MQIPTEQGEEWRPVPGSSVYWVSSLGRVWSQPRERTRGGVLAPTVDKTGGARGRQFVMIGQRRKLVHQLVAGAFHGPRPEGMETRHLDGDKTNNRADNLTYGTRAENMQDAVEHGTHFSLRQVTKTHCPKGHPLVSDYRNRRGSRVCRPCANRQSREYRARRRAAS